MQNSPIDPYRAPHAEVAPPAPPFVYVGFWARVAAALIDTVLLMIAIVPLLYLIYGESYFLAQRALLGPADFLLNYVVPAVSVVLFWKYLSATPGKLAINARIVDAATGGRPSTGQLIGRYLAYYVSLLPLGLGCFWVAWDARKQGWHDKLAGTLVVRPTGGEAGADRRHVVTGGTP